MNNNYFIENIKENKKGMGWFKKPKTRAKSHLKKLPIYENVPKSPLPKKEQNKNKVIKKKKKKNMNNKINGIPHLNPNNFNNANNANNVNNKNKYMDNKINLNNNINNYINNPNTKGINKLNKKHNPKMKRSTTPLSTEDKNIY